MNYFEEYKKAHTEMTADVRVVELEREIIDAQSALAELKEPYQGRLQKAEEGIRETVLDQQRTVVLHGVEAIYSKPRKTTSWKGVAMSYEPPAEVIEEHSKTGNPSVRIKIQD